jgi:hypothetical protein
MLSEVRRGHSCSHQRVPANLDARWFQWSTYLALDAADPLREITFVLGFPGGCPMKQAFCECLWQRMLRVVPPNLIWRPVPDE